MRAAALALLVACAGGKSTAEVERAPSPERAGDRDLLLQVKQTLTPCSRAAASGEAIAEGCSQLIGLADHYGLDLLGHSVNADMLGSQLERVADSAERAAAALGNDNPSDDDAPKRDLQGLIADLEKAIPRYDEPGGLKLYPAPPGACQATATLATTALRNLESSTHRLPQLPTIYQAHGVDPLASGLPQHARTLRSSARMIQARAAADRAWWDAACASDAPDAWAPAAAALRGALDAEAGLVSVYASSVDEVLEGRVNPERKAAIEAAVASWQAAAQAAQAAIGPLAPKSGG